MDKDNNVDVFISYSHKDKAIAGLVCSELESNKIKCWYAPRDILPGESWGGAIVKAISSAKVLILIFTSSSNESDQVLREVERAVNKKLKVNFVVKGWKAENDQVALEANEKVTTSDGDVILDEKELFSKGGVQAISAADAEFPRLSVVISQVNKLYDFYLVSFKIWNKGSDQSIEGNYKFHVN
jgi:hypothetical protein